MCFGCGAARSEPPRDSALADSQGSHRLGGGLREGAQDRFVDSLPLLGSPDSRPRGPRQTGLVIWEQSQRVDDDEVEFIVDMDKKVTQQPRG